MQKPTKQALVGALVLLAVVLYVMLSRSDGAKRPAPDAANYYTGPMRNKNNPNIFVTDDGKIVPPPPGTKPLAPAESKPGGPTQKQQID